MPTEKPRAWVEGEDGKLHCSHCGERSVLMRFPNGSRDFPIDPCIASIVKALNDGGVLTVATCCGHGSGMGNIWLEDGRVLVVLPDYDSYSAVLLAAIECGLVKLRQF